MVVLRDDRILVPLKSSWPKMLCAVQPCSRDLGASLRPVFRLFHLVTCFGSGGHAFAGYQLP